MWSLRENGAQTVHSGELRSNVARPACPWKTFLFTDDEARGESDADQELKRWSHRVHKVLRHRGLVSARVTGERENTSMQTGLTWLFQRRVEHDNITQCTHTSGPSPRPLTRRWTSKIKAPRDLPFRYALLWSIWIYGWRWKKDLIDTVVWAVAAPWQFSMNDSASICLVFFPPLRGLRWQRAGQSTTKMYI